MMTIPHFDRRNSYSTDVFQNSIIQTYLALFISKPDQYKDINVLLEADKQTYFFKRFRLFLLKYYHFNIEKDFDLMTYFGDLQMNKKGSVSICGGGDSSRNAKKNALKSFNNSCQNTLKSIEYLNQKYKIIINSEKDDRVFIGHKEIWKNPSPQLLNKENFEWVLEQSYDDMTFVQPFPNDLDKYLIPLDIRNKVYQKWKNQKSKLNNLILNNLDNESKTDTEEEIKSKSIKEQVVIPELLISDDLQREIDELF